MEKIGRPPQEPAKMDVYSLLLLTTQIVALEQMLLSMTEGNFWVNRITNIVVLMLAIPCICMAYVNEAHRARLPPNEREPITVPSIRPIALQALITPPLYWVIWHYDQPASIVVGWTVLILSECLNLVRAHQRKRAEEAQMATLDAGTAKPPQSST